MDVAARIAGGTLTAQDYARACLDRVKEVEGDIRAFVHFDPDHVMAQARALDERKQSGAAIGPLHGVPVGIKDIIDTEDYPTECGSPLFAGRRPFRDAHVVARLRAAGAIIFGKTVSTEFAYFHPGATRNPHDSQRTPGGSSSGSAAAVASGMIPLAIGSQTNGSVIRPAAFCGVVGVKPSHGMISRSGVLLLSRKLDHVGVFARSLPDAGMLLDVLAGYDADDADTRPLAAPAFARLLSESWPLPPRLAFIRTPAWDRADPATREAFEQLATRLGEHVHSVDLPDSLASAWNAHRSIMSADMASRFSAIVEAGGEGASQTLRDLLAEGRKVSAYDYLQALDLAERARHTIAEMLTDYHAILTPAARGVAPRGLEATGDPVFNSLWTLTGLPAVTLPLLTGEDDMPLGVQLVGAPNDDARLLRTASWLAQQVSGKSAKRRGRS
jgi:Asp-tRNA(Asn)/Glu-tRNA(Gln) amidotransferase A subunit family amidase